MLESQSSRSFIASHFHSSSNETESIYYKYSFHQKKKAKVCMVILHDLYDYHERYLFIDELIANNQISEDVGIVWIDLKGFGLSSGARGYIDDFDEFTADIHSLIGEIEQLNDIFRDDCKIIFFGQGLGALVALRYHQCFRDIDSNRLNGLVLVNPIIKLNEGPTHWSEFLFEKIKTPLHHFKWTTSIDLTQISSLKEEVNKMQSDVLVSNLITYKLYDEVVRIGKEVREDAYFLDIPTLCLLSQQDNLIKRNASTLFFKGALKSVTSIKIYPNSSHDLVHDRDVLPAIHEVFDWLKVNYLK